MFAAPVMQVMATAVLDLMAQATPSTATVASVPLKPKPLMVSS